MATVSIVIKTNQDPGQFLKPGQGIGNINRMELLIKGLKSGALVGSMGFHGDSADPVLASGTATLVSVVATNSITIAGTALTFSAAPVTESDVLVGGSDAATAANLVASINAHSVLKKIVKATSALGVVTISCVTSGPLGNLITLAKSGAPITLSGAALSGGAGAGGVTGPAERVR